MDVRLAAELGRDAGRDGPVSDMRLLVVLAGAAPGLDIDEDVDGCLVLGGGGPIDVRAPPTEARGFAPTEGARVPEGVPVRETEVLEAPLSCFVGDFVGDLARLVGRATLGTGLGLGAFKLFLLPKPVSPPALDALPEAWL
jgi:hypothetical protein